MIIDFASFSKPNGAEATSTAVSQSIPFKVIGMVFTNAPMQ
jgi:hypothetical protein